MRKKSGQPNEFGIFVKADAPKPAAAPAPVQHEPYHDDTVLTPAPAEEPAAEAADAEDVAKSDGWSKKKSRKSK